MKESFRQRGPNPEPYDPSPCGSGRKYKFCCRNQTETVSEKPFIAEIRPDLDAKVDDLLRLLEAGASTAIESKIRSLWEAHPRFHTTNFAMGVYLLAIGNDPEVPLSSFEKAVEIVPPFPEAHFNLGAAAIKSADILRAVAAYLAAVKYSHDDGIAEMGQRELRTLERIVLKDTQFKSLDDYLFNAKISDSIPAPE